MNTRDKIIYESLKLFSVSGYEAVSTRMIAKAAGVSDTAMYKHFEGKQEIFDTIIEICKARFNEECSKVDIHRIQWTDVEEICMNFFKFQIEDEWIVMFRRVLVIEQFRSPEMGALYRSFFIDRVVDSQAQIFTELMQAGYIRQCNPRVMALELYAPFFMFHTIKLESGSLLDELREHVTYFRNNYKTEKCNDVPVGI